MTKSYYERRETEKLLNSEIERFFRNGNEIFSLSHDRNNIPGNARFSVIEDKWLQLQIIYRKIRALQDDLRE